MCIFAGSLAIPVVLTSLRSEQQNPQRFYACSAMANASANPRLAEVLKANAGIALCFCLRMMYICVKILHKPSLFHLLLCLLYYDMRDYSLLHYDVCF